MVSRLLDDTADMLYSGMSHSDSSDEVNDEVMEINGTLVDRVVEQVDKVIDRAQDAATRAADRVKRTQAFIQAGVILAPSELPPDKVESFSDELREYCTTVHYPENTTYPKFHVHSRPGVYHWLCVTDLGILLVNAHEYSYKEDMLDHKLLFFHDYSYIRQFIEPGGKNFGGYKMPFRGVELEYWFKFVNCEEARLFSIAVSKCIGTYHESVSNTTTGATRSPKMLKRDEAQRTIIQQRKKEIKMERRKSKSRRFSIGGSVKLGVGGDQQPHLAQKVLVDEKKKEILKQKRVSWLFNRQFNASERKVLEFKNPIQDLFHMPENDNIESDQIDMAINVLTMSGSFDEVGKSLSLPELYREDSFDSSSESE